MKCFVSASITALLLGSAAVAVTAQEMTLALTGDAIITRRLSVYDEPEFLEMIELVRGADAAFRPAGRPSTSGSTRCSRPRSRKRSERSRSPTERDAAQSIRPSTRTERVPVKTGFDD